MNNNIITHEDLCALTEATKTALAAALLACIISAGSAHAAPEPIDVATLEARAAEAFAQADTDGDGLVTAQEFADMERPARSRRGTNDQSHHRPRGGSAHPDMAQRQAFAEEMFDLLDRNDDDSLSREEFSSANQQAARRTLGNQRAFARLDLNDDGVLTIEEFPPSRLARRDTDGDGTITRDELKRGRPDKFTNGS